MRVETRDGTSVPLPSTAVYLLIHLRICDLVPFHFTSYPPGPSQMSELSGRMNALISQSCSATMLSFDNTNVVVIGREYD